MIHLTLPGELDVMGASLLTTNRVAIGFNKDLADPYRLYRQAF